MKSYCIIAMLLQILFICSDTFFVYSPKNFLIIQQHYSMILLSFEFESKPPV